VTRDLLNDQVSRLLSDVVKNDASSATITCRWATTAFTRFAAFPSILATGLEINGMTIAGEQDVPLENKQSVEILKGIAGVESGVACRRADRLRDQAAGGIKASIWLPIIAERLRRRRSGPVSSAAASRWARVNLASERIASYMNDTNGWRAMGAGAADWKLSPNAILKGDFEYQHKTERDGSGYQLLGGTTVPDINNLPFDDAGRSALGSARTPTTLSTPARVLTTLCRITGRFASASYSHSLIQDNVIYAYGTPFDANGNVSCPNAPNAPAYFFAPTEAMASTTTAIPGELRIDAEAEAMVTGT
jgi:iron complex outermembrane recepter protein